MKKLSKLIMFSFLAFIIMGGCTKEPGVGGSATVTGKIYVKDYNSFGTLVDEYYAQDYNVYLIYGDDGGAYDDDVSTSHDGAFEFKYLQKGKYELFLYSKHAYCSGCTYGSDSVITVNFEVTDKKQIIELSEITVFN